MENSIHNHLEHSLFGRDCINNSVYSQKEISNNFNNQKYIKNLNKVEIPYHKMIPDENDIFINFKNNNNNESIDKKKNEYII